MPDPTADREPELLTITEAADILRAPVATLRYWRSLNRSDGSVNSISSDAFCTLGRAPTFSDNLVQVARVN